MEKDIENRQDVDFFIREFYERVKADPRLAPVFAHVDWEHHTPIIVNFWSSILLGDDSYKGNPFQKHINLPITSDHFDQWLFHFNQTIDKNFTGPNAEEAKQRALSIAGIFKFRLGLQ